MAKRPARRHAAYDHSGPPPGFGNTFLETGDLHALQAAADWYRDRAQPADPDDPAGNPSDEEMAYYVEVYRYEMEIRQAQARLLRVMLTKLQPTFNYAPAAEPLRASETTVERLLRNHGFAACDLLVWQERFKLVPGQPEEPVFYYLARGDRNPRYESTGGRERWGFRISCPTDRIDEEGTRLRLIEFLRLFFPRAHFVIEFKNAPGLGDCGSWGEGAVFRETYNH